MYFKTIKLLCTEFILRFPRFKKIFNFNKHTRGEGIYFMEHLIQHIPKHKLSMELKIEIRSSFFHLLDMHKPLSYGTSVRAIHFPQCLLEEFFLLFDFFCLDFYLTGNSLFNFIIILMAYRKHVHSPQ